jgi:tetratricopeptide (TPR) repeat protein
MAAREHSFMANINLREYIHEIENLIESGQNDEAIAHCHHILGKYPRNLATHRLLGKAYLEMQRYEEAARVFQHVLECIPDDFTSHLGMSVIRDHEGQLEASVWHMERAFDIQPANALIQGELRRLYQQRDGLEPQKIHLTRGALARMYAKGDLYPQAISELRAALAEDPKRPDLQIVLAKMYMKSGQLLEAAEACKSLLSKLPDCMEAHYIQATILSKIDRSGDARKHYQLAAALDPYIGHVAPGQDSLEMVPDESVVLERLEDPAESPVPGGFAEEAWSKADPATHSPAWYDQMGKAGQDSGEESAREPDQPQEAGAEKEAASEQIPDWMQSAGWKPASGKLDQAADGLQSGEDDFDEENELVRADIPDWIKPLAPPEALESLTDEADEQMMAESDFTGFGEERPEGFEEPLKSPMAGQQAPEVEPEPEAEEDASDWLDQLLTEDDGAAAGQDNLPGNETTGSQEVGPAGARVFPFKAEEEPEFRDESPGEDAPLPDWMSAAGAGAVSAEIAGTEMEADIPDWLRDVKAETPGEGEGEPEMPDWLKSEEAGSGESFEGQMEDPDGESDLPDWLKSLAEESSASEELLPAAEDETPFLPEDEETGRFEEPAQDSEVPDWLRVAMEEKELPVGEQDEDVPDWLKSSIPEGFPEEPPPITGDTKPIFVHGEEEEAEEESVPEAGEVAATEGAVGDEEIEETPEESEFLAEAPEEVEALEAWEETGQPSEEEVLAAEGEEEAAAMAWLESLAARQGALEEELLTRPEERPDSIPDWLQQMTVEETGEGEGVSEDLLSASLEGEQAVSEQFEGFPETAVEEASGTGEVADDAVEAELAGEQAADEPTWPQLVETKESTEIEGAVEEHLIDELPESEQPDWHQELESEVEPEPESPVESEAAVESETDLPEWLREFTEEETVPKELEPDTAADTSPLRVESIESAPAEELQVEAPGKEELAAEERQVEEPQVEDLPVVEPQELLAEAKTGDKPDILAESWSKMVGGEVANAIDTYNELIQNEQHLEQVIHDLREAAFLYPEEILLHQALGDAYLRSDRLQEALDAYNKAEELLKN